MSLREKQVRHGYNMAVQELFFVVAIGAILLWVAAEAVQTASLLILVAVFLMLCGPMLLDMLRGVFGESKLPRSDTRSRVLAMEDYHGIEYQHIPAQSRYVEKGNRLVVTVEEQAAEK